MKMVCVRVCVCIYIYIYIYTYTHAYAARRDAASEQARWLRCFMLFYHITLYYIT